MGQLGATITITPEIYLLWEGEPLELLGLHTFLKSATIGTTTRRSKGGGSSKRARYYIRRKPKVAGAQLVFLIPNQIVAFMFMELFERNARPKITVGFRSPEVNGGEGVFIGTYKIDTLEWKYPTEDSVELTISGKTDRYLGLTQYKAPRVFHKKTVAEIVDTIAKDHNLIVEFDEVAHLQQITLSPMKPSGESDWAFLDRVAEVSGYGGMSLQPSPSLKDIGQAISDRQQSQEGLSESSLQTAYTTKNLQQRNQSQAAGAAETYLRSVLKFSRAPSFEHGARTKKMPKITLAYGPGITGEIVTGDSLVLLVAELSAKIPHLGGGLASSARVDKNNRTTGVKFSVPAERGVPKDKHAFVPVGGAQDTIKTASRGKRRTVRKSTPIFRTDYELPGNRPLYKFYTSALPHAVSNDLAAAHRAAVRTKELGHIGEFDVTLSPGFPFLNSPAEVLLIGTYIHDGVYGVEEATHTYDDSGLKTKLRLLRIGKATKKNVTAKDPKKLVRFRIDPKDPSAGGPVFIEVGTRAVGSTANGTSTPGNPTTRHPPMPPKRGGFVRDISGSKIRKVIEDNARVPFIQRIINFKAYPKRDNGDGTFSTHLLAYVERGGKYLVYPELQFIDGGFVQDAAFGEENDPMKRGNFITFTKESEAAAFSQGNWKPLYIQ